MAGAPRRRPGRRGLRAAAAGGVGPRAVPCRSARPPPACASSAHRRRADAAPAAAHAPRPGRAGRAAGAARLLGVRLASAPGVAEAAPRAEPAARSSSARATRLWTIAERVAPHADPRDDGRARSSARTASPAPRGRGRDARAAAARRAAPGRRSPPAPSARIVGVTSLADLPLRPDLVGRTAYGAPQLHVPVTLNVNENTHPVPQEVRGRHPRSASRAALDEVNRYPDREFTALREALAGYLGHGLDAAQHLGGERLERGAAARVPGLRRPGPHAARPSRRPTRMYPNYAVTHRRPRWSRAAATTTSALSPETAVAARSSGRGPTSSSSARRTTRRARPSALDDDRGGVRRDRRHASSSTRRTASSCRRTRRARSRCCPAGRASSSPAP